MFATIILLSRHPYTSRWRGGKSTAYNRTMGLSGCLTTLSTSIVPESTVHSETMLIVYVAGFGPKALPGKWDDCTLNAGQTPIGLGITNE